MALVRIQSRIPVVQLPTDGEHLGVDDLCRALETAPETVVGTRHIVELAPKGKPRKKPPAGWWFR